MKLDIRPPYWTIERAAEEWGCMVDDLIATAAAGELQIDQRMHDGAMRRVILRDECARIEATYAAKASKRPTAALRADARRTYEDVIACLLVMFYGTDPALLRPYEATNEMLQWAARVGLPMARSTRKYAGILADVGERLRAAGIAPEAAQESPQAPPSDAQKPAAPTGRDSGKMATKGRKRPPTLEAIP